MEDPAIVPSAPEDQQPIQIIPPTTHAGNPVVRGFLASGAVAVFIGSIYAYFSVAGLIHMGTARTILVFAWLVGIAGIIVSETIWGKRSAHKVRIGIGCAIALAIILVALDAWTVRHVPEPTKQATADEFVDALFRRIPRQQVLSITSDPSLSPPENAQEFAPALSPPTHRAKRGAPRSNTQPIDISILLTGPAAPTIQISNQSDDRVADGVSWELVTFRESDQAFFSFPTQVLGYVKPQSKSGNYFMNLKGLPHAPNGDHALEDGDHLVGTLIVDCPLCRGQSLIVSLIVGSGGWYRRIDEWKGTIAHPKDMSTDGIARFVEQLQTMSRPDERIVIQ
jgi:hypothetical protein